MSYYRVWCAIHLKERDFFGGDCSYFSGTRISNLWLRASIKIISHNPGPTVTVPEYSIWHADRHFLLSTNTTWERPSHYFVINAIKQADYITTDYTDFFMKCSILNMPHSGN